VAKSWRQRTPEADQPSKIPGGEHKLAVKLYYLKVYPSVDVIITFSSINNGECCRWVHKLLPVLEELPGHKLALPKRRINSLVAFAAALPNAKDVLLDGTVRPVQRSRKNDTTKAISLHYSSRCFPF
jgi:hypothetical protein